MLKVKLGNLKGIYDSYIGESVRIVRISDKARIEFVVSRAVHIAVELILALKLAGYDICHHKPLL